MIKRISFLLLTSASAFVFAQNEPTDPIYKVEVILFERTSSAHNSDPEAWPKNIELAYPDRWVRLLSESEASVIAESAPTLEADQFSLSSDFLSSIGGQASQSDTQQDSTQEVLSTEALEANNFYRFLSEEQKTLLNSKKQLDRMGNLRTLFHEAWLQPMKSREKAPGLVLRAGNLYENHGELEGTITLSVGRYLHIETNLWFTEFTPNYGQISEHWPALPSFPADFLTSEELNASILDDAQTMQFDTLDTAGINNQTDLLRQQQTGYGTQQGPEATTTIGFGADTLNGDPYQELLQEAYIIKETVTMQQKRRMRSNELHYLDHPKLGILIKIIPYEDENGTGSDAG